jgi:hypothetical protein
MVLIRPLMQLTPVHVVQGSVVGMPPVHFQPVYIAPRVVDTAISQSAVSSNVAADPPSHIANIKKIKYPIKLRRLIFILIYFEADIPPDLCDEVLLELCVH